MGVLGLRKSFTGFGGANTNNVIARYWRRSLSSCNAMSDGFGGQEDSILPVLIIGAGPVGLVLSILLTKLGVKCAVMEKSKVFSKHPQAHFINNRTMEVFRNLDGLEEEIQMAQPPVDFWRKFIYCTSLTGPIIGSVDHMQPQDFDRVISPTSVAHFSQYKLTSLLTKKLEKFNFHTHTDYDYNSVIERVILMGHECVSIDDTNSCLRVTASFLDKGQCKQRTLKCGILVGTDGSASTVRKLAGIEMRGEKDLQKLVSVHFISRDLGHYLLNERPGMLFFIFNTEAIGVLVAHDLKEGEFILQIPFYPPQQKLEDFGPETCERLIIKLVGRELADINVIEIKPWVMHAEVAEKFVTCDNKVVLAGDAAHRFPPAGGFGMNTGIQDAHNLAWKLASVVKGISPRTILHTYETERRPVAISNTSLSIQNFSAAMSIPTALGLDPSVANSVHSFINQGIGSVLPSGLQRAILEGIFTMGRAQVSELVLNENNPLGSFRLSRARRILEEGKSLQLQFPAEDLGFRYYEGALVSETASLRDESEVPSGRRRDYVPSATPGARLPHMNVRLLRSDKGNPEIFSMLDLVSGDKLEFLLIIAPVDESYDVARAAYKLAEEFKISVRVCVIWPYNGVEEEEWGSNGVLEPWKNFIDVVEVRHSSSTFLSWWDMCQMTDNKGVILVRPDQHIAWRGKSSIVNVDHTRVLRNVFSSVVGVTRK